MRKQQVITILTMLLIILWIYAALSKLMDYPLFLAQLNKQPFPKWSLSSIAVILPLIEICAAILLIFQRTMALGFKVSMWLMLLFTLYVMLAITRTFGHIPCPCAGIIGRMPWTPHLIFNIFFTLVAYAGCYLQKHTKDLENSFNTSNHYSRITGKRPNA